MMDGTASFELHSSSSRRQGDGSAGETYAHGCVCVVPWSTLVPIICPSRLL